MRIWLAWTGLCAALIGGYRPCSAQVTGVRPPITANQQPVAPRVTRTAEECAKVEAPPIGTPHDSGWSPPEARQLILPPLSGVPGNLSHHTILARFTVGPFGTPTRIDLVGIGDSGFARKMRATFMSYRFAPAVYNGCVVTTQFDFSITFGGGSVLPTQPVPPAPIGRTFPAMTQPPWTLASDGVAPLPGTPPANCEPKRPYFSYGEWPDATGPGGNGRVELRFVIDSSGTPIDSTVRVLESTAPKYLSAVKKVFPTLHFTPAWCDGGPVAMDVQQVFYFYKN